MSLWKPFLLCAKRLVSANHSHTCCHDITPLTIPHLPAWGVLVCQYFASLSMRGSSSIMERRKCSKVCLHFTKRYEMLPCVISSMDWPPGAPGYAAVFRLYKRRSQTPGHPLTQRRHPFYTTKPVRSRLGTPGNFIVLSQAVCKPRG